ncbi:hypothetical protein ACIBEJ_48665 [Nonomuraea sp. NPDC050790]|uniref:hypothetical protein n=1 Tax=Nonomuraea sp. NPDC050790 TaxID=3364371 RepID=UPI0037A92416
MRAVTESEPEWLEEDLDWALAQYLEELGRCPTCGLPRDETVGPHAEGRWESPPPAHCHACSAIAARRKEWDDSGWDQSGLLFFARKRETGGE